LFFFAFPVYSFSSESILLGVAHMLPPKGIKQHPMQHLKQTSTHFSQLHADDADSTLLFLRVGVVLLVPRCICWLLITSGGFVTPPSCC
jgi:hypothetical protein